MKSFFCRVRKIRGENLLYLVESWQLVDTQQVSFSVVKEPDQSWLPERAYRDLVFIHPFSPTE